MSHHIFSLDISYLSMINSAASIDGEIVLLDNMDIPSCEAAAQQPQKSFPVQANMSMILLCMEGEIHLRVALKEYIMQRNMFCIIIAGNIFEVLSISDGFKGYMIATRSDFMPITENATQVMAFYKCLRNNHCFTFEERELREFINIYRSIKSTLQDKEHPFKIPIIQSYTRILYYWMVPIGIKESELQEKHSHTRQEEIFERFINEVEGHYRKERSIKFYADLLCITPKYLSSVIYKVSQRLAGEWIDDYVILEAKTLLKSGRLSIQQISEQLNFPNQSFFGKFFKRYAGMSPKEYKNS